jgi:hypothetical protein
MMIRLVAVTYLLMGSICNAAIIGTDPIPPASMLSGFGSSEVYRGETFRLSSGPAFANTLTVFVGPTSDLGANFRVLITEVDMTGGFHPTNVIFESGDLNVPVLPLRREPDPFVVGLGGLLLQPGRDYAWILDYFVAGNPQTLVSMETGLGSYPDGTGFSFLNGPFFPAVTRQDHFASNNWFVQADRDFAFQLNLSAVPPPPAPLCSTSDIAGTWKVFGGTTSPLFQGFWRGKLTFASDGSLITATSVVNLSDGTVLNFSSGQVNVGSGCRVWGSVATTIGVTIWLTDGQMDKNKSVVMGVYDRSDGDQGLINFVRK